MIQPPDDRNRDSSWSDDAQTWAETFVIPDDISTLEPDIEEWRREEAQAQRQARPKRITRVIPARWRRYGITAPLLIATLLLVGSLGALTILIEPRATAPALLPSQPLASSTVTPGRVSALLPSQTLSTLTGAPTALTSLRPAVLTLTPAGCDCRAMIAHISAEAAPYGLVQYVVAPDAASARDLVHGDGNRVVALVDPGSTLLSTFGATAGEPTIVLVRANGIVHAIETGTGPNTTLTGDLDGVVAPATRTIAH